MSEERRTDSGIELRPVYGADDLVGFDPAKRLGLPGEPPFSEGGSAPTVHLHPSVPRTIRVGLRVSF